MDDTRGRLFFVRRALAVLAVVVATVGGGAVALSLWSTEKQLSVGTVRLGVDLGHRGALDIYVPVVDWGARFPAIRLPARLHVDVRAIDRGEVERLANGGTVDVDNVRAEARDAIASYIRVALLVFFAAGLAAGLIAALAVRGGATPRLRMSVAVVAVTAAGATVAVAILLPPRGAIDRPQYYAFGPDIPRALEALETARRSSRALDQELNSQLVGLARLVTDPADRPPIADSPRVTLASDLHNNVIGIPILERAARGGAVLFAGDLTDRGSTLEARLVERVVGAGDPFVFVSGNHDSDALLQRMARDGAIVLTEAGRLNADGSRGSIVVRVGGLRVAGYGDPFERRASEGFADRFEPDPGPVRKAAFAGWLEGLIGKVDVVMVHDVRLAETALQELETDPPSEPLVLHVGHSHKAQIARRGPVTIIDGGSIGAGGTGNLDEQTDMGLSVLAYTNEPRFEPLAADLVSIDPATGSATARRERLDEPAPAGRGA